MNRSHRPYPFSCYHTQEHVRRQGNIGGHPYYVGNNNEGLRLGQLVTADPPVGGMEAYVRYLSAAREPVGTISVRSRSRHLVVMRALVVLAGMLVLSDAVDGHDDLAASGITVAVHNGSAATSRPTSTISTQLIETHGAFDRGGRQDPCHERPRP